MAAVGVPNSISYRIYSQAFFNIPPPPPDLIVMISGGSQSVC